MSIETEHVCSTCKHPALYHRQEGSGSQSYPYKLTNCTCFNCACTIYVGIPRFRSTKTNLVCAEVESSELSNFQSSIQSFQAEMLKMLLSEAAEKGYGDAEEGGRELQKFVEKYAPGHSRGEIIYKIIRYGKKKDKRDLVKAAAWAFLLWDMDNNS